MSSYNGLREFLADMEHQQWIYWSKFLSKELILIRDRIVNPHTNPKHTSDMIDNRLEGWKKLWKPYKKLTFDEKEQDRVWADKILDNVPIKCPLNQCGGIMQYKERIPPEKDLEEYDGDWQTPDLVCSNCGAIYQFQRFKKKGERKWL